MGYKKIFNPRPLFQDFRTEDERSADASGDRRDGKRRIRKSTDQPDEQPMSMHG